MQFLLESFLEATADALRIVTRRKAFVFCYLACVLIAVFSPYHVQRWIGLALWIVWIEDCRSLFDATKRRSAESGFRIAGNLLLLAGIVAIPALVIFRVLPNHMLATVVGTLLLIPIMAKLFFVIPASARIDENAFACSLRLTQSVRSYGAILAVIITLCIADALLSLLISAGPHRIGLLSSRELKTVLHDLSILPLSLAWSFRLFDRFSIAQASDALAIPQ